MKTVITAQCFDQSLTLTNAPKLASGGENEFQIELTFDEYWNGFGKEAVFYKDRSRIYRVVLVNNIGVIPWELTAEPGKVHFSIRGASGSTVRTSSEVVLTFVQGAPMEGNYPAPLPDVYKQVLSAEGRNAQAITAERARIDNLVAAGTVDNAELLDVRVGANGRAYASAGAAVREQIEDKADRGEVARLREIVTYDYQYMDFAAAVEGEYWTESGINAATGYRRYPVIKNLPAGTYYIENLSANFTIIENIATGAKIKLNASGASGDSVVIDYPFNLYATQSTALDLCMFGTAALPDNYVAGAYNIDYKQENPRVLYCGPTREYTKLIDAIDAATQHMDTTLFVDRGVYDLIAEYGAEYFANYTTASGVGMVLKNRVHVIFEQGAKVVCNYAGDNVNVHTYFSPFNAGEYGFTLENAYVESTNTRYTMHDELSGAETPNRNIYRRCTFIHDSTRTTWGAHQALGGGFGCWGDVLVEDCYMSAKDCEDVLTYHNAGYNRPDLTDYASKLVIRGCYIEGTIRVNSTGYSEQMTRAFVSGNSLTAAPHSGKTTEDAANNVILYAWGNEIRG